MDSISTGSTHWWGSVCPDVGSPTLPTTQPFVRETGLSPNAQINREGNSNLNNTLPSEGSSWASWEGSCGPILMRPWWFWTNSSSDHPSLIFSFSVCMMGTVHYQCHCLLPQQLLWKKDVMSNGVGDSGLFKVVNAYPQSCRLLHKVYEVWKLTLGPLMTRLYLIPPFTVEGNPKMEMSVVFTWWTWMIQMEFQFIICRLWTCEPVPWSLTCM